MTIRKAVAIILVILVWARWPLPHAAADTYAVTNTNDSGAGSDTIMFNISGSGPHTTITLLTALTSPVSIDGTTEPPVIRIDG